MFSEEVYSDENIKTNNLTKHNTNPLSSSSSSSSLSSSNSSEESTSDDFSVKKNTKSSKAFVPVFVLYSFLPGLKKLVERIGQLASTGAGRLPPVPQRLQPYKDAIETFFLVKQNGAKFETELLSGLTSFLASLYILPVISHQFSLVGYDENRTCQIMALIVGLATIVNGIISNSPIVIAPPTSLAIFFSTSIAQSGMTTHDGNMAVFYSGVMVLFVTFIGPIGVILTHLIPEMIQASTAMGVGLITVLAGYTEINLVVQVLLDLDLDS
jgi:hypothetical protein